MEKNERNTKKISPPDSRKGVDKPPGQKLGEHREDSPSWNCKFTLQAFTTSDEEEIVTWQGT
jgi:hypothetical protein